MESHLHSVARPREQVLDGQAPVRGLLPRHGPRVVPRVDHHVPVQHNIQ